MVSQFVSSHPVNLLGDLNFDFPAGTHAIGRLDANSEGLLLLSTDKRITRLLFNDEIPHHRTYLVQVNNTVDENKIALLRAGVNLRISGDRWWTSVPAAADIIGDNEYPCQANSPLPSYPPFTWLCITITEGKFHQIRKMIFSINHRCRRLIRIGIEDMMLDKLRAGEVREVRAKEFFEKLKLRVS